MCAKMHEFNLLIIRYLYFIVRSARDLSVCRDTTSNLSGVATQNLQLSGINNCEPTICQQSLLNRIDKILIIIQGSER